MILVKCRLYSDLLLYLYPRFWALHLFLPFFFYQMPKSEQKSTAVFSTSVSRPDRRQNIIRLKGSGFDAVSFESNQLRLMNKL